MAILKCKMCGGTLEFNRGDKVAVCDSCGTKQTIFYTEETKSPRSRFTIFQKPDYSVSLRELVDNNDTFLKSNSLTIALGKDYDGNFIYGDLAQLQHILITGASGFGKTNCLREILYSLLYRSDGKKPTLILVDTKRVEFSCFNGISNMPAPVINDPEKVSGALTWVLRVCSTRVQLFAKAGVRDINSYNEFVAKENALEPMQDIVVVIDDLYQVLLANGKQLENNILQIIQNGRICGVHLIIVSQQADRKFLPDKIKTSFPTKLSFVLRTAAESKYIFGRSCAENLSTVGDMIYQPLGSSVLKQVKCAYVPDEDIQAICNKLYTQQAASTIVQFSKQYYYGDVEDIEKETLDKAVELILEYNVASTSFIQRKLGLGYARCARLIVEMEEMGIIGPSEGTKPRKILMTKQQWIERKHSMN